MSGVPLLPDSRGKILDAVQEASKGMLKYFTAAIPDLLLRPASQKDPDKIRRGDIVLFTYEESAMAVTYKLGLVTRLEFDSDNEPRIAELSYSNAQETDLPVKRDDKTVPRSACRLTRKGIHTLIKVYAADDRDINTDIDHINDAVKMGSNPVSMKETEKDLQVKQDKWKDIAHSHQGSLPDPVVPNIPEPLLVS